MSISPVDATSRGRGPAVLTAAVGSYPHTRALMDGRVASPLMRLAVVDLPAISRAFAPMVRDLGFDVCEMALVTLLQAKASGVPIVLLPVVLVARAQEAALLCRTGEDIRGPADLAGRRIGVRSYGQTTAMWLRGILAEDGLRSDDIRWVTFEDAHVAGIADPAGVERAAAGSDMLAMLQSGEIDAAIVGSDAAGDSRFRTVHPDPAAAGAAFRRRHGFVPVNHVLTVRRALADDRPDLVADLLRMFDAAADVARAEGASPPRSGRAALEPALALALRFMAEDGLLDRPFTVAEAWDGLPPALVG